MSAKWSPRGAPTGSCEPVGCSATSHSGSGRQRRAWPREVGAGAAVRLGLEQRCALSRWDCERRLYQDASPGAHVADGVAWFGDDPWAVEVDLTQKSRRRLEAILAELLGRWPGVFYVCSTDTIRAAVADVAAGDAAVHLTPLGDLDPRCAP